MVPIAKILIFIVAFFVTSAHAQFPNSVGGTGFSIPSVVSGVLPPLPGLTQTFSYVPANDGLALVQGGPTLAGYQADAAANPSRKWMPRIDDNVFAAKGSSNVPNGEYQWFVDPAYAWSNSYSPFSISSGNLIIRARTTASASPAFAGGEIPNNPVGGAAYTYVSGIMTTQASFSQTGGYYEIEAQFPYGKAIWPAFWLLPTNRAHPPEIDINEYVNINPNNFYQVNAISLGPTQHSTTVNGVVDLSAGFHKYAVYFDDSLMTWYLDGVAVATQVLTSLPEFGQPFYILMNQSVGSTISGWVPAPDGTTPNPSDFTIKSVKAWQRSGPVQVSLSASSYLDNLTVGQTVATISSINFGGSSSAANVYTIISDPDSMFNISGSNLNLAQVVLATTKNNHQVTIRATDTNGKTYTRLFTLGVITATPIQANYITSQDVSNAFWTKNNTTTSGTDTLLETATTSQHGMYAANITRTAAIKTFTTFMEVEPVNGRAFLLLQTFSGNFGSSGALCYFDLINKLVGFCSNSGAWSGTSGTGFVTPIPGTSKLRVGFDIVTDASTTNITISPQMQPDSATNSYLGNTSTGMKFSNMWLYNKNAGAGGT